MLSRPEIGTRGHIKLWLAGKDPNEKYQWCDSFDCACGQYAQEFYGEAEGKNWLSRGPAHTGPLLDLNHIAKESRTFGALYENVCKAWAEAA